MLLSVSFAEQIESELISLGPLHADDADLFVNDLCSKWKRDFVLNRREQHGVLLVLAVGISRCFIECVIDSLSVERLSPRLRVLVRLRAPCDYVRFLRCSAVRCRRQLAIQ